MARPGRFKDFGAGMLRLSRDRRDRLPPGQALYGLRVTCPEDQRNNQSCTISVLGNTLQSLAGNENLLDFLKFVRSQFRFQERPTDRHQFRCLGRYPLSTRLALWLIPGIFSHVELLRKLH